jgi:hypothetical protein
MPALTNSQFLPYQLGTDRRCDAPEVWQAFLAQFETRYRPILNVANRLNNNPMAVVERRNPYSIEIEGSSGGPVEFDTVVIDTDGMVNLDSDPTLVTPQRPGYYYAVGIIRATGAQVGTQDLAGNIQNGFAGNTANNEDEKPSNIEFDPVAALSATQAIDIHSSAGSFWNPFAAGAGTPVPFRFTKTGSNTVPYEWVQLAVYWIRDL